MNDHREPDVASLNFLEFDIEALERRLELVEPGTSECYYCIADSNCNPVPAPQEPVASTGT